MKNNFLLLVALVVLAFPAQSQEVRQSKFNAPKQKSTFDHKRKVYNKSRLAKIQAVNVIWSDDFSNPLNWEIAHVTGTTGDWVVGKKYPSGLYKTDTIASPTSSNGIALFDSDKLCSGNQVANLTIKNPIDLTGHSQIKLRFFQLYRKFYDSTFVFISTDKTNWTKIVVNGDFENNDLSRYNLGLNPELVELDISSLVGNKPSVYIRFTFFSPSTLSADAGCGYSWQIDDVQIYDIPANDLVIDRALVNVGGNGSFSLIPKLQVDTARFVASYINKGLSTQNNVKLNVKVDTKSATIYDQLSEINPSIAPADSDTAVVFSPAFFPGNKKEDFLISFSVKQDEADDIAFNNDTIGVLSITDTVYARDNNILRASTVTNPGFYNPSGTILKNESKLAVLYPIISDVAMRSVSVNIDTAFSAINTSFIAEVYDEEFNLLNFSEPFYITKSSLKQLKNTDGWVTLPMLPPAGGSTSNALYSGKVYVVAVSLFEEDVNKPILINADRLTKNPVPVGMVYKAYAQSNQWGFIGEVPFIRLNVDPWPLGLEEVKEGSVTDIQNVPNPFTKSTTILYTLDKPSEVSIEVFDLTGKKLLVKNEGVQTAGKQAVSINADDFAKGVYFYTIKTVNGNITRKMVIQ